MNIYIFPCLSGSDDVLLERIYVVLKKKAFSPRVRFYFLFLFLPVFCYKGSESSSVRPEPRLESLNPDAPQSTERAIHLLI